MKPERWSTEQKLLGRSSAGENLAQEPQAGFARSLPILRVRGGPKKFGPFYIIRGTLKSFFL